MPIMSREELEFEGISPTHAKCFLQVASDANCVILTRTPGKACLTLLADGYDAKGFHVKAKSCDWGPMAGFICAEPMFNKSGLAGAIDNLKANVASLSNDFEQRRNADPRTPVAGRSPVYSSLVHVEISDARLGALLGKQRSALDSDILTGAHSDPKNTVSVKWMLKYNPQRRRWALYYDPIGLQALPAESDKLPGGTASYQKKLAEKVAAASVPAIGVYQPVLALTNPYRPYTTPEESYKNALTGDFDLFAVWPHESSPDLVEYERRVAGMGPRTSDAQIFQREAADGIGSVVGNISNGVHTIGQLVNSAMTAATGHAQVNRIFHSDEGGRPSMKEIDASVAFHPNGKSYGLPANSPVFADFVVECAKQGFVVFLNRGWTKPLEQLLGDRWPALERKIRWQDAAATAEAPSAGPPSAATNTKNTKK